MLVELLLWLLFAQDVNDLGAGSFARREAASRRLEDWDWLVWPLLDRTFTDAERSRRARRIVARARPRPGPWPALLPGGLLEWWAPDGYAQRTISSKRPGPRHTLVWIAIDPHRAWPLGRIAELYLEHVKRHGHLVGWYSCHDAETASATFLSHLGLLVSPRLLAVASRYVDHSFERKTCAPSVPLN